MPRSVELLPMTTGDAVLDLLPRLARALAGDGPALLPADAGEPGRSAVVAAGLGAGTPLAAGEDDPADPTALVVATSGSTGAPKGALLSCSALAASAAATQRRLTEPAVRRGMAEPAVRRGMAEPATGRTRGVGPANWLLALPAQHIAGLQVLLRSLAAGTAPTVLDTAESFTAERFAAAVGRMPAGPRFVSLVPTQLRRILVDAEATAALATFDAVLVGGSATDPSLMRAATDHGVHVVATYGMSETCGGCVYDGVPLDGVTVTTDGCAEIGRLQVIGPVVARGYRGLPDHPAFVADPASGARRFRTDDLGTFVAGRWRVLGRLDDVIVTGGVNVSPAAVESVLTGIPGVAEAAVTGIPDPAWGELVAALIVPSPLAAVDATAIRSVARDRHGPAAAPRVVILVDELPLRGPGKPDRSAIRQLAERVLGGRPVPVEADRCPLLDARRRPDARR